MVKGTDIYGDPTSCTESSNGFPCTSGSDYYMVYPCDNCKSGYIQKSIDSCRGTVNYCEQNPNAVCTDIDVNCISCEETDEKKCKTCKQGYELDSSGYCVMEGGPFGQNGCSSTTNMVYCGNTIVYSCSTSCLSGYVKKQISTSCGTYEYCDEMNCNDQNCRECSSPNYCTSCYYGYHTENGVCVKDQTPSEESSDNKIICNVKKCISCDYNNHCSLCDSGYYESNGECKKYCYASYCEECDEYDNYKCKTCNDDYYNSNGECKRYCYVSNCDECNSFDSYKCETCNEGYYNLNDSCVDDYVCSDNCEKCYYNNYETYCEICENGYYKDYGKCYKCEENCLKCEYSYGCTECEESYALFNHECQKIPENSYYGDYTCSPSVNCNDEDVYDEYIYEANECYNMDEKCGDYSSFKLIQDEISASPWVIFYSESECYGYSKMDYANYCYSNSGQLLFMLLTIILIAIF